MLKRRWEHPGTKGAIFRRTYDLVRENHVDKYLEEYAILRQWYRKGDAEINLPNGSSILFRYGENKKDIDAHIGKEYMDVIADQAEAFSEAELVTLKSCARWPGLSESACKFTLTFNPGNIGHAFLKRIFYDRRFRATDGKEYTEAQFTDAKQLSPELGWLENPAEYAFIQAYGWDNVEWARSALADDGYPGECGGRGCGKCGGCVFYSWDSDRRFQYYITRTQFGREQNALPPAMRIGWLLGNMDQFAGQYYDIFSPERHIKPCQPHQWHTRWIGIDWGFSHLSGCYWASQIAERLTAIYREFCESGRSPKALAQEIVDRTPPEERPLVKHIFLSHDAFAKRTEQDTIADQMATVFRANGMPYPEQASKDPTGRATLLYDMMGPTDPNTGQFRTPEIVIDPSCQKLIQTIPMVCRDPNKPEATLKFYGDDPFDGCLVKGTMISTEFGPMPIEIIRSGVRVWTRQGLRRVTWAGLTKHDAATVTLRVFDGRSITGTGSHPIWSSGTWISLVKLAGDDKIDQWQFASNAGIASRIRLQRSHVFAASAVSTLEAAGRADVYNLEVEGCPEYLANGILVHNCTHALTYRMREAKVPREIQIMEEANRITDPTARWFFLRKHQQQKIGPVVQPKVVMPWERSRQ